MDMDQHKGVPRFWVELGTAALTFAFGVAVCLGAREAGAGWTDFGPDAGYFPFYIGLLIALGSGVNFVNAFRQHRTKGTFLDARRARFVAAFLLPMLGFALVATFLGLYVGTTLYVAAAMMIQGRYPWWRALGTGLAVAVAFFLIFELAFKVPLLKGPVEAWLGLS